MSFEFKNIHCSYKEHPILKGISASFAPNSMVAIMGYSGAGKTTLLKILSGRNTTPFYGEISINKSTIKSKTHLQKQAAYVFQHDVLPEILTVDEYCHFVGRIKSKEFTSGGITSSINILLNKFGIGNIQFRRIGSTLKGLSGGQRKRVSIVCETLGNPQLFFLDEPTTGLDCLGAYRCVKYIKSLNILTFATVHQPSSTVFNMFDTLLLLKEGRIFYKGPTSEVEGYINKMGFSYTSKDGNIADYLFTFVLPGSKYTGCDRNNGFEIIEIMSEYEDESIGNPDEPLKTIEISDREIELTTHSQSKYKIFTGELKLLLKRDFKKIYRDKRFVLTRILMSLTIALVIGPIFYNIPKSTDILMRNKNITGFIYQLTLNTFYNTAFTSTTTFYGESELLYKEYKNKYYSLLPYYISYLISTGATLLPFPIITPLLLLYITRLDLSTTQLLIYIVCSIVNAMCSFSLSVLVTAGFSQASIAMIVLSTALLPMSTISGLVADPDSLILPMRMFQYISFPRYFFNIMVKNTYSEGSKYSISDTDLPLKKLYGGFFSIGGSFMVAIVLSIFNLVIGFYIFKRRLSKD